MRHLFFRERERRNQHEQRDHREVLEEQHAHHAPPVLGVELHAVGELLGDDRRGRHRDHAARDEPLAPRKADGYGCHDADRDHDGHLGAAESQHEPPHAHELRQAEFQPHGEHQEHHAELGEVALALGLGNQAHRVRSDHGADDEVAQDRGDREAAEEHDDQHRGSEQDQRDWKGVVHHGAKRRPRFNGPIISA